MVLTFLGVKVVNLYQAMTDEQQKRRRKPLANTTEVSVLGL